MFCRLNFGYECDCCGKCRSREVPEDDMEIPPENRPGAVVCHECGKRVVSQYWIINEQVIGLCCIDAYLDREAVLI